MRISPHTHIESTLTGSTLPTFLERAKTLNRTHFTYTDNGTLSSALKVYGAAKKKGLKPILGVEFYFKSPNCDIIGGSKADKAKYFQATIYAKDQIAYQELCKTVSQIDLPTINIYDEPVKLWSWKDLEHLSQFNTSLVLCGVQCLVGKTMLANEAPLAEQVLLKLKKLFKENLYTAILAEPWAKKWYNVIEIKYEDGSKDSVLSTDLITTDRARNIKAIDLVGNDRHSIIVSKSSNMTSYDINKKLLSAKLHKGYLPLPGGDASLKVNRFLKALSTKHGITTLVTDYAYYAEKSDKIVQTVVLGGNIRLHPTLSMKSEDEVLDYLTKTMLLGPVQANEIIENNSKWASQFDSFELTYKIELPKLPTDEDPIKFFMGLIKEKGRMPWSDKRYTDRLRYEIDVLARNGTINLLPYFYPIYDVVNVHTENNILIGSSRGSVGGVLLAYLLGITQVDPIKYDLSFERFISADRIKAGTWPDIDIDLPDRSYLVGEDGKSGYLHRKYPQKTAQVSTKHLLRLKSAIADVCRALYGEVLSDIKQMANDLPSAPQGVSDYDFIFGYEDTDGNHIQGILELDPLLQKYISKYPDQWAIVQKSMGIVRHSSVHASAFIIANSPIDEIVPMQDEISTQYDAKDCESAGLIKFDFLKVSHIFDIQKCIELINKKNGSKDLGTGNFVHNGKQTNIWDLPEDLEVFKSIWNGETETLFQIHTKAMTPFVKKIQPKTIDDISAILALVRPGPLDYVNEDTGRTMADEYVERRFDRSTPDIPQMAALLPETYGVQVYQEQTTKVMKEIGRMDPIDAENLRRHFSKKDKMKAINMKPMFIRGATETVGDVLAEKIWAQMETSSRYSFNKSHSIGYAFITYATMFLKHYYKLEWWAAILTNASEKEITGKLWPYVKDMLYPPDINLSTDEMVVDYKNEKIRSKLGVVRGMGDKSIDPIIEGRPYKDIQDFVDKSVAAPSLTRKLIHVGILDSLFSSKTNLLEKLKSYENAVEKKKYEEKLKKAELSGKKVKALQPKEGEIPEEYINLHPMLDATMKKAILPSLPVSFFDLGKRYSKVLSNNNVSGTAMVLDSNGRDSILIPGNVLEAIDLMDPERVTSDKYFAATCYVVEAKEFTYAKGAKRALKMILQADNYSSEKVLWPDYNTGELMYPKELRKGSIVTVFFKKRAHKKDTNVVSLVVEA